MWRTPSGYLVPWPAMTATARSPIRTRPLRIDAERNRAALLDAARAVFSEQGVEAPLEEVAARAGVGIATLYRRFPTRQQLVAAALVEQVARYARLAQSALEHEDPWAGFAGFVEGACALQARDRGLSELLSMALPPTEEVERLRRLANARITELIERAKQAGVVRPDFVREDLRLLLLAHAAVVRVTHKDAPEAWSRFTALMLDAFAAQDRPPLPSPPSAAQMTRVMRRLAEERGCAARHQPSRARDQEGTTDQ